MLLSQHPVTIIWCYLVLYNVYVNQMSQKVNLIIRLESRFEMGHVKPWFFHKRKRIKQPCARHSAPLQLDGNAIT
jgi:hypothetical protein